MTTMNSTSTITDQLWSQWANPLDISTILLVIGGDVVQKAFARGTGKAYTPVCFSFGCVAYAFIALVNVIGDGRLLPAPDYPAKIINLQSGSVRDNKNWVLARVLRDLETASARRAASAFASPAPANTAIRITVYETSWPTSPGSLPNIMRLFLGLNRDRTRFPWTRVHLMGLFFTLVQIGIAVTAWVTAGDWSTFLITMAGTALVQVMGALPQWTAEKLPNRQKPGAMYALTSGNGANDVIVIIGFGNLLDLEELATPPSPRGSRLWEKFEWLSVPNPPSQPSSPPSPSSAGSGGIDVEEGHTEKQDSQTGTFAKIRRSKNFQGIPIGFWITRIICCCQSILWLLLLINVGAPKEHSWFLLAIGGIGMFQNAYLAAMEQPAVASNIPLKYADTFATFKVMDGIMDFHDIYGHGQSLVKEYFPGLLSQNERDWWAGNKDAFEKEREADKRRRKTFSQLSKAKFRTQTGLLLPLSSPRALSFAEMGDHFAADLARPEMRDTPERPVVKTVGEPLDRLDRRFTDMSTGSGTLVSEQRFSPAKWRETGDFEPLSTILSSAEDRVRQTTIYTGSQFTRGATAAEMYDSPEMRAMKAATHPTNSKTTDAQQSVDTSVQIPTTGDNGVF